MLRLFLANRKNNCSLLLVITVIALLSCNRGEAPGSNEKPEDNRFTKVVLAQGFDEPMAMSFTNDGRVLIVERKGALKAVDIKTNQVKAIAVIPVNTKYTSKEGVVSEAEEGLMGIVVHPDFAKNRWIYMYYADANDTKHVLRTQGLS
jgi:cytochrome c